MHERTGVSRRHYLRLAGGAGTAAVAAGCMGESQQQRGDESAGKWYTPDGDRFQIEVLAPSNGTWPLNAQTAVETFKSFGIDATAVLREKAAYGKDMRTSSFGMAINVWGVFQQSRHPYTFFSSEFASGRARDGNFDPTAMEVPYPIGDPTGDTETVDVKAKLQELGTATGDAQNELIREVAWIYNQTLPRLPLMNGVNRVWGTNDDWELPPKDSEWIRENAIDNSLRTANIQAKSGSDDDAFTVPTRRSNPNDMQWNPYFAQASGRTPNRLMYERLAITSNLPNDVEADVPDWTPMLLDSVEMGDGTFEITIKGDRTWTDGDPVTAEDLATQLRVEKYLGQTSGGVWDELTVADDQTLSIDIGERNPELVASTLLPKPLRFKRDSRFGDWLTQYQEASGEEERESVSEEIVQAKIGETESYGLWRIDSISNSRVVMTLYEDHPLASEVNFDTVEIPSIPSNQKRWQSLSEDRIDALFGSTAPTSIEESFPDHAVRLPYASGAGDAVVFNHGQAPFDDRRVRKAVAFLVNRWRNTHNAKDFVSTIEYPIGLANQEAKQYLDGSLDDYQRYGYRETRGEEATRLLEAAGYTRE